MHRKLTAVAAVWAIVLTLGVAAFAAPPQEAAKVDGTWQVSMTSPRGTFTQTLTLKQDGTKLTGTIESRFGSRPVEGTLDGNNITFSTTFQTPNGDTVTSKYTGTVSGDTMKGTIARGDRTVDWTAKLQK